MARGGKVTLALSLKAARILCVTTDGLNTPPHGLFCCCLRPTGTFCIIKAVKKPLVVKLMALDRHVAILVEFTDSTSAGARQRR